MSSDHSSWAENYSDSLIKLFQADEKIIKNLINELNNNAPNFHMSKIEGITKSVGRQPFLYLSALSVVVHFYLSHKTEFDEELKNPILNSVRDKITSFISSLDDKGKNGLNVAYLAELQYQDEDNQVYATKDEFILKSIYDEDGKVIGELPLIKLSVEKRDSNNMRTTETLILTINAVKSMGEHFMSAYKENITHAKHYKNKIGDSVIIYDDE